MNCEVSDTGSARKSWMPWILACHRRGAASMSCAIGNVNPVLSVHGQGGGGQRRTQFSSTGRGYRSHFACPVEQRERSNARRGGSPRLEGVCRSWSSTTARTVEADGSLLT